MNDEQRAALLRVRQHIVETPERFDMRDLFTDIERYDAELEMEDNLHCGTALCMAGWALYDKHLSHLPVEEQNASDFEDLISEIAARESPDPQSFLWSLAEARALLGLPYDHLFYTGRWPTPWLLRQGLHPKGDWTAVVLDDEAKGAVLLIDALLSGEIEMTEGGWAFPDGNVCYVV